MLECLTGMEIVNCALMRFEDNFILESAATNRIPHHGQLNNLNITIKKDHSQSNTIANMD
jgi:hypothetical protein